MKIIIQFWNSVAATEDIHTIALLSTSKIDMHGNKEKVVEKQEYLRFTHLRCTPTEYGLLPILRAVNDAQPDENHFVGNFSNNADADRGFFCEK